MKKKPSKKDIERLYKKRLRQKDIGEKFGIAQSTISVLMKKYRIKTRKKVPWSNDEEKILKKYYLQLPKEKIILLLPKRSWKSIKLKAFSLGLTRKIEEYRQSEEVLKRLRLLSKNKMIKINWDKKRDVSYVLGVLDGDGYTNKKCTIGLETKSPEFAKKFMEKLKNLGMSPNIAMRKVRNNVHSVYPHKCGGIE